jgi:FixJ family two-component response regulator
MPPFRRKRMLASISLIKVRSKMTHAQMVSIVDDDPLAREGIKELVESLGYKASAFVSAHDFLRSGAVATTCCVITDLQMPGLNGLELQERLQARGYRTPVILITAYPDEKHRCRAMGAGAIGFLSKPFEEQALVECLTTAMKQPHEWPAASC